MALALWAGLVRVQHRGGARGACVVAAPKRRALAEWAAGRTVGHAGGDGGVGVHVAWYGMLVCMMCHAQAPGPMAPFLAYGACGGCQIPSPALCFWRVAGHRHRHRHRNVPGLTAWTAPWPYPQGQAARTTSTTAIAYIPACGTPHPGWFRRGPVFLFAEPRSRWAVAWSCASCNWLSSHPLCSIFALSARADGTGAGGW